MSYFLYKLIPPRRTFALDMSREEAEIMSRHVAYWQELADRGVAVAFGPVADPAGSWGLGLVEAEAEEEVKALRDADPAVTSGLGSVEIYPMPGAIVRSAVFVDHGPSTRESGIVGGAKTLLETGEPLAG